MTDDIDVLLHEAGRNWRAAQPGPVEPDWNAARDRRPVWMAAAALLTAAIVIVAALSWPAGHRATPSAPASPLVPYAKGAVVPAPFDHQLSPPKEISYCPIDELAGTLTFHRTPDGVVGQLRLRLTTTAAAGCSLPGMLATGPRLLDRSGAVRGTSVDPRSQLPINLPNFDSVALKPGQSAVMYLRAQTTASCLAPIARASISYQPDSVLQLPVSGLHTCPAAGGSTKFWYGPFSTAARPVALPSGTWSSLSATLDLPPTTQGWPATRFRVTLTNRGTTPVSLAPCPQYGIVLSGPASTYISGGSIGCPRTPRVIRPGQRIVLTMSRDQDVPLSPGRYTMKWAIAGVPTATAHTIVR